MKCDDQKLTALLAGEENSNTHEPWITHVEHCPRCQSRLRELAADDDDWQKASRVLAMADDSGWTRLMKFEDHPVEWSETMVKQLLDPPTHPEVLGRLGRYDIERLIGSGGMGIVFKAYDSELNRPVAVKILAPFLAANGSARKRFAREARAAAGVVDDHVVPIFNVESECEPPFLVMKFVAGGSLQEALDRDGPLEVPEILRIGVHAAKGLAAAHAQGLIHRDVKPSNILLDEGVERALLTDFGLARAENDAGLTRSGFHPGTPHYMSPEQARGESIDARSDLFGLGCVMYALCTGHPPFRAESSYAVLRRIADDTPRPIGEINPNIPEWLQRVVMKLLAKSPDDRFDSASTTAELLQDCLAHAQQPATNPLPKPIAALSNTNSRRPTTRRLAAAAGFAASLILSVVLILELNKGTLQIESEVDDIPIRILSGDEVCKELTVTKSANSVRIAAGTYRVEIVGDFDGVQLANGRVDLQRLSTKVISISKSEPSSEPIIDATTADEAVATIAPSAPITTPKRHPKPGEFKYDSSKDERQVFHNEKLSGSHCFVNANKDVSVIGDYFDYLGSLRFSIKRHSAARVTGHTNFAVVDMSGNSSLDLTHLQIGGGGLVVQNMTDNCQLRCGEILGPLRITKEAKTKNSRIVTAPNTVVLGQENLSDDFVLKTDSDTEWASRKQEFSPPIRTPVILFEDSLRSRVYSARDALKNAEKRNQSKAELQELRSTLQTLESKYKMSRAMADLFRSIVQGAPDAPTRVVRNETAKTLMNEAIDIARSESQKHGITVNDEEVAAELQRRAKWLGLDSEAFLAGTLSGLGLTKDQYRKQVVEPQLVSRKLRAIGKLPLQTKGHAKLLTKIMTNFKFPGRYDPQNVAGLWVASYDPLEVSLLLRADNACVLTLNCLDAEFQSRGRWKLSDTNQVIISLPNLPDGVPESDFILNGINGGELNYKAMIFDRKVNKGNSGPVEISTEEPTSRHSIQAYINAVGKDPGVGDRVHVFVDVHEHGKSLERRLVLRNALVTDMVDPHPIKSDKRPLTLEMLLTESELKRVQSYEHRSQFFVYPVARSVNNNKIENQQVGSESTASRSKAVAKTPTSMIGQVGPLGGQSSNASILTAELAKRSDIEILKTIDLVIPLSADHYSQQNMRGPLAAKGISISLHRMYAADTEQTTKTSFAHLCDMTGYSGSSINGRSFLLAKFCVPTECRLGDRLLTQQITQAQIRELVDKNVTFHIENMSTIESSWMRGKHIPRGQ